MKRWPIDTWSGFDLLANRPMRAQAFVACLSFVAELLGWKGAEEASHSQRVLGAAHLGFLRKRMLRQAPPSDVVAIVVLALCCLLVKDDFLWGCAGFCFCAFYGRLRVSDCNRRRSRPGSFLLSCLWGTSSVLHGVNMSWRRDNRRTVHPFSFSEVVVGFSLGRMGLQRWLKDCMSALPGSFRKSIFNTILHTVWRARFLTYANIFGLSLEQNELCDGYARRSKNRNIRATICKGFPFCQQDHGGAHYQQFAKSVESAWETVAECIPGFTLDYGDAAFTEWFYGETARDHSCGSVDKPCERNGTFPTHNVRQVRIDLMFLYWDCASTYSWVFFKRTPRKW